MSNSHVFDKESLSVYLRKVFPEANSFGLHIDALEGDEIILSMKVAPQHLRPGGTVSGPTMFALADYAAYLIILAHIGEVSLAVTTSLNINFMRKPEALGLRAVCRLIKLGKRLAVCEVHLESGVDKIVVAQATATYSLPKA